MIVKKYAPKVNEGRNAKPSANTPYKIEADKRNKRYVVLGSGWQGHGGIFNILENGKYFDKLEDAEAEYDRLWREELEPDEGACIFDLKYCKMIKED